MLAQVASFILNTVGVLELLEELHLLNDVLPLLHVPERRRKNHRREREREGVKKRLAQTTTHIPADMTHKHKTKLVGLHCKYQTTEIKTIPASQKLKLCPRVQSTSNRFSVIENKKKQNKQDNSFASSFFVLNRFMTHL